MSTILDALRKVEREREPSTDPALNAPIISPEVRRRRPFPVAAVVICAVVGFTGGAVLSWWSAPREPPVEVAALPVPPPPPDINVPRAPVLAQPKAPRAASSSDAAAQLDVVAAPEAVAPSVMPPAVAAIPSPEAAVPVPVGELAAPAADRPLPPQRGAGPAIAAVEKGSALEPSPFGPARDGTREAAAPNPAVKPAPAAPPPVAGTAPTANAGEQDLAALVPPTAQEPPAVETDLEHAPEPEPEAPAETIFDTGRSPPGAPKVALSFLQWSTDPARRFAFISIDGAPTQRVREGEVTAGLTVAAITPTGVQFKREGTTFVIRPRH